MQLSYLDLHRKCYDLYFNVFPQIIMYLFLRNNLFSCIASPKIVFSFFILYFFCWMNLKSHNINQFYVTFLRFSLFCYMKVKKWSINVTDSVCLKIFLVIGIFVELLEIVGTTLLTIILFTAKLGCVNALYLFIYLFIHIDTNNSGLKVPGPY